MQCKGCYKVAMQVHSSQILNYIADNVFALHQKELDLLLLSFFVL